MIDIMTDIQSLTEFKRNTSDMLSHLKETHRPVVLTVNGKSEVVVQDVESYQKLLDLTEKVQSIEAIKKSLEEIQAGKGISFEDAIFQLKEKYNVKD